MKTILLNEIPHQVNERFENYTFHKKPSSNVYAFGHTEFTPMDEKCNIVIQFNNRGAYLYEGVEPVTVQGAIDCESIGRYYRSEISGKHTGTKLTEPVLTIIQEEP